MANSDTMVTIVSKFIIYIYEKTLIVFGAHGKKEAQRLLDAHQVAHLAAVSLRQAQIDSATSHCVLWPKQHRRAHDARGGSQVRDCPARNGAC